MNVRVAPDLALHVEEVGTGAPVVLLHGFTGSGREWDSVVAAMPRGLRALTVDLIGHGESDAPSDAARYRPERASGNIRALLDSLGIARAHVVGYSLGGRVALRFVLDAPERVGGLVLVSATAGIDDPLARAARQVDDLALAARIEREGVERFVDEWGSSDLFATERSLPAERRAATRAVRLAQRTHGLAHSLRGMGQGAMEPLWDRIGEIGAPTLVVTGARDARYSEVGARLSSRIAGARHVALRDAGHAVHRERPAELAALIAGFLLADPATRAIRTTMEALT